MSPSWKKLIVDGKTLHIFASSGISKEVRRLSIFKGIDLLDATKEEREPYIEIEERDRAERSYLREREKVMKELRDI